jgi:hypothetical protein
MWRRAAQPIIAVMPTLVLVTDSEGGKVVARPARLRERLAARWRAGSLERELARGAAPESAAALALRAQELIGPSARAALARRLSGILRDARRAPRVGSAKVPPQRRAVVAAARDLERLAARLLAPGPVSTRGVAQVRVLLSDGCGPLYADGPGEDLRSAVTRALEDVEVPAQSFL